MILMFFRYVTCEKIIDIIVRSKYQKVPCPIWGEPVKEIFKFLLSKLEIKLISASKNEKIIKGCSKIAITCLSIKTLTAK